MSIMMYALGRSDGGKSRYEGRKNKTIFNKNGQDYHLHMSGADCSVSALLADCHGDTAHVGDDGKDLADSADTDKRAF